ncbi:MAG: pyrroloquinoline quinone biosynthesis protein PqqB [Microvirga sp.]
MGPGRRTPSRSEPRALVLGAAAGGGFPQWNCRCAVCALAWDGDPRVTPRTQSSVAVTGDNGSWALLNASPDLPQQIRANADLWPRGSLRDSPIGTVVITSADVDHVAGLLSLRERQPFRLVALAPVHADLRDNPVFGVLADGVVERVEARPGEPVETAGLTLELVPVPGKAPLYREGTDPAIGSEAGEATAVIARAGRTTLAYVPGCAALTPALLERLGTADILLFDGTLYSDEEMIAAGVGTKTGRRMGHLPIAGPGGSLERLRRLPARRKIYIHINNTNPILIAGSPERAAIEAAGFEAAFDGMEISL